MSENMVLYEKVRSVPKEALKAIGGGRLKGMSDINPMWRIKMLTEMFGICGIGWKIEVTDKRLEHGSTNEIVCFVDILLYVKVDNEWSASIPGMGGSSFVTLEKGGAYTSDECFKMAYTDAISVACKSLGFAADVYFANDSTKYTNQQDKPDSKPQNQSTSANKAAQTNTQTTQQNGSTGQTVTPSGVVARVYDLRKFFKWEWSDLNKFATQTLGREIKFLKNDIKTSEEWEMIERDLLELKSAS